MSFRKEKKYPVTKFELFNAMNQLKKCNIKKLYPARLVFSTYFDSLNLIAYKESSEGILPRKKYRIRTYPENQKNEFFLEQKISSIEGSFKKTIKISKSDYEKIINSGIQDQVYGKVVPIINIWYSREYYLINNIIRVTLDTKIQYKKLNHSLIKEDDFNVIEFKTNNFVDDDYIFSILNVNNKRFSKYCQGIDLLKIF